MFTFTLQQKRSFVFRPTHFSLPPLCPIAGASAAQTSSPPVADPSSSDFTSFFEARGTSITLTPMPNSNTTSTTLAHPAPDTASGDATTAQPPAASTTTPTTSATAAAGLTRRSPSSGAHRSAGNSASSSPVAGVFVPADGPVTITRSTPDGARRTYLQRGGHAMDTEIHLVPRPSALSMQQHEGAAPTPAPEHPPAVLIPVPMSVVASGSGEGAAAAMAAGGGGATTSAAGDPAATSNEVSIADFRAAQQQQHQPYAQHRERPAAPTPLVGQPLPQLHTGVTITIAQPRALRPPPGTALNLGSPFARSSPGLAAMEPATIEPVPAVGSAAAGSCSMVRGRPK